MHMTEEEQIAQIKRWWKTYGNTILWSVIIVLGLIFAWRYWNRHEDVVKTEGSVAYQTMLNAMESPKPDTDLIAAKAAYLIREFPGTPYADVASLEKAKLAVDAKKLPEAVKDLQWVIDNGKAEDFVSLARLRLARIYLAEKQYDKALTVLAKMKNKKFLSIADSQRGDVYLAQGKRSAAHTAYAEALQAIHNTDNNRPILQMKLNSVADAAVHQKTKQANKA